MPAASDANVGGAASRVSAVLQIQRDDCLDRRLQTKQAKTRTSVSKRQSKGQAAGEERQHKVIFSITALLWGACFLSF